MYCVFPNPASPEPKKGIQVRFFWNGHQTRMDKGPPGTIEKYLARKNIDSMIKGLTGSVDRSESSESGNSRAGGGHARPGLPDTCRKNRRRWLATTAYAPHLIRYGG